jgi:hypothetical protein
MGITLYLEGWQGRLARGNARRSQEIDPIWQLRAKRVFAGKSETAWQVSHLKDNGLTSPRETRSIAAVEQILCKVSL